MTHAHAQQEAHATPAYLSSPAVGSQLSDFNKRWADTWLFLDSMRLAAPRPDLGGIVVGSFGGGTMILTYTGTRPGVEFWGLEKQLDDEGVDASAVGFEVEPAGPGRLRISTPPDATLFLRTTEPPSAFTLVPEAHEDDHEALVWYPRTVELIARGGPLRAIHLQATNWWYRDDPAATIDADALVPPDAQLQSGRFGVSAALLADLANRAGVDLWYCAPHSATDAYLRAAAEQIKGALDPDAHILFELGNEVWNAAPPYAAQHMYFRSTLPERLPESMDELDGYAASQLAYADRVVEAGAIFEDVLGEGRVTVVLAQQCGVVWFHDLVAAHLGEHVSEVEALAVAPYFGHGASALLGDAEDTTVLDRLGADLDETIESIEASADAAARHGWPLIAYEGGAHLVPPGGWDATHEARSQLRRINEHPRMGALYTRWLDAWANAGGGLMMHYGIVARQDGRWGAFGLLHDMTTRTSPKLDALDAWAERSSTHDADN